MKRNWIFAVSIVAVLGGLAVVSLRDGARRAKIQRAQATSASVKPPGDDNLMAQLQRWVPFNRASAGAAHATAPAQPLGEYGVTARARRIADSAEFVGFAKRAQFDKEQQQTLARILAAHYENERALAATAPDLERMNSLHRQLMQNTQAQLRTRMGMSDALWDMFEHSGLLAAPTGENPGALPAPGQDPT